MTFRPEITIAFIVIAAGCRANGGSIRRPLTVEEVAGCYRFSWRRADSLLQDASLYPDLVRLEMKTSCPNCAPDSPAVKDLSLGSPLPDTIRYAPGKPVPWHRRFYASWWRIAGPDTVSIMFNGNVERWQVRLSPAADTLKGGADYWSDGGMLPPTEIIAEPMSCAIAA